MSRKRKLKIEYKNFDKEIGTQKVYNTKFVPKMHKGIIVGYDSFEVEQRLASKRRHDYYERKKKKKALTEAQQLKLNKCMDTVVLSTTLLFGKGFEHMFYLLLTNLMLQEKCTLVQLHRQFFGLFVARKIDFRCYEDYIYFFPGSQLRLKINQMNKEQQRAMLGIFLGCADMFAVQGEDPQTSKPIYNKFALNRLMESCISWDKYIFHFVNFASVVCNISLSTELAILSQEVAAARRKEKDEKRREELYKLLVFCGSERQKSPKRINYDK